MSQYLTRRALLGCAGTVVMTGVAGCGLQQTEMATPTETGGPTTYGISVSNRLEPDDFEQVAELSGPVPVVVHVRVNDLNPDSDQIYFEETAELDTGDTETFPEAFTADPDGPTYAVNATLEPIVEGGLSRDDNRKDGIAFAQGSEDAPAVNPIPVVVRNAPQEDGLFPNLRVHRNPIE